jgi:hypothetical protein
VATNKITTSPCSSKSKSSARASRPRTTVARAVSRPPPPPLASLTLPDTQGFDVTGIVTTVEFFFPEVRTVCDCIQKCLDNPTTCANYIWDFHDPSDITRGHRTCVIYSNFNLPSNVTVVYAPNDPNNVNIQVLEATQQNGSTVPQAFTDVNGTVPDDKAFSGCVAVGYAVLMLAGRCGSWRTAMFSVENGGYR